MILYGLFILGVNIKYRLFCTSLPPYGGYTGERVNQEAGNASSLTDSLVPSPTIKAKDKDTVSDP